MTEKAIGSATTGRLTRRDMLKVGGAVTFAGYAVGVETALAFAKYLKA